MENETENVIAMKRWISENGGQFHPDVCFKVESSGYSVIALHDIPPDTPVVWIPVSLAITPEVSAQALSVILPDVEHAHIIKEWSERQLICSYICMHWILEFESAPSVLAHRPYIDTLPAPDKLRTPLHFTSSELEAFKGTNLYGATLDRQNEWQNEWRQCQGALATFNERWAAEFTWERYLTAATYLSSRAFSSTLLSAEPSLVSTAESHPVLLPGIDALNHARAEPVSWVVSGAPSGRDQQKISLVLHNRIPAGSQLFNNYGPKPNAELILGYGFSLPENPDDTIVLKIGGNAADGGVSSQKKWEVGRNAQSAQPVWEAVLAAVCEEPEERSVEDELYAADMLAEMAENLFGRLPSGEGAAEIRPEVALMLEHYLEGQRSILQSLIQFARNKELDAIEAARANGLEIVEEDEDEGM